MTTIRTSVVIDLAGNMAQRARQFGRSVQDMAQVSSRNLMVLQKAAAQTGRVIDGMANRYTALVTGGAMASATSNVIAMDKSMRALGVSSGKTADEMALIQKQLLATAQMSHIRIDVRELEASIAEIAELTGDLDFALASRETMAMTISATGASGAAVGGLFAEFNKSGFDAKEVSNAVGILIEQGKEGAFTMQNLANMGPRVVSAYATSGRSGTQAYKEMGAALQVIRMSAGSSEQATTTFEALMRAFNDVKTLERLEGKGIQVFDPEALKNGVKQLRPINELMTEIVTKAKGDATKIGSIFTDSESARAFNTAIAEYKRIGKVEAFDKFMNVQGDPAALMGDSQRMADSYASLRSNLNNAWMEFSTKNLGGGIESLADGLRSLTQEDVQRWMDIGKNIFYVGAAVIAARKAWQAGAAIKGGIDWYRGAGKGKAGAGGAPGAGGGFGGLGGRGGAVPVYLVDGPMSVIPERRSPAGKPGDPVKGTTKRGGKFGRAFSSPKGMGLAGTVIGGAMLVPTLLDDQVSSADKVSATGGFVGGAGGALAGAAAGAALGSVVPLLGTAIGGIVGGILGGFGGDLLGTLAAEKINTALDVNVKVDGPPGTTAHVSNMKASGGELNADIYNGSGMVMP
jgi:hypothetical protein